MFYTSISGLNAFRQQLALISDNIANSQTRSFKAGDVSFAEVITSSSSATSSGNGVSLSKIAVGWTQGAISNTGNANDYAITGSGFFVVRDPSGVTSYTRDGQFLFDADGKLINAENSAVMGYVVNQTTGEGDGILTPIIISSQAIVATPTENIGMTVNLNSGTAAGGTFSSTINTYDSQGNAIPLTVTFAKVVPTFSLNLYANTLADGDTVKVGGLTYTARDSYTDIKVDLTGVAAGDTVTVGGQVYRGSDSPTLANEFNTSGTDAVAAASLDAAIATVQGAAYGATNALGILTITAGTAGPLNATSVTANTVAVTVTVTPTAYTLLAGEFAVSDDATADAISLQAAINELQGSLGTGDYAVGRSGSTVNITAAGATILDATSVVLGTASTTDIEIKSTLEGGWSWAASIPAADGTANGRGFLEFDETGSLKPGAGIDPTISIDLNGSVATPQPVTWDIYTDAGLTNGSLTQYAAPSTLYSLTQDGAAPGEIKSLSTDNYGIITAAYSNGTTRSLYQIALADFKNYDGLNKTGNNSYRETPSISGQVITGVAGSSTFGTLVSGSLEASNVDMAKEMANMILAQRAYESCARVFTTESEMLKTIVQMT